MKKLLTVLLALFVAAGLSFLTALPVSAQEDEKDEAFELEEITVTAEKRSENLQDVARSVIAISADDLEIRSADQVQQILENTAGITFVGGGPWLQHIGMRGVLPNTSETGTEGAVQFSVDGNVAMSMEGNISPMFSAMNDVERVEVIRGPSGSVQGRMAAAGSIRVITKDPDFEKYDGYVGYTIGNYDTTNIKAALNVPLSLTGLDLPAYLENMALRSAIRQDKHSDYITNSDGDGAGGSTDFTTWRTKFKWAPTQDLTMDSQFTYSRDYSNNWMSVPLVTDGDHRSDAWYSENGRASDPSEAEQFNYSVQLNYVTPIGDVTAKYAKTWIPVVCSSPTNPDGSACYEGDKYQKEYEAWISSLEDSKWKWMAGVYMFNKKEYTGPDETLTGIDMDKLASNRIVQFSDFYYTGGGPPGSPSEWGDIETNKSSFPANDPSQWPAAISTLGGEVSADSIYFFSQSKTRPIDSFAYYGRLTIPVFEDTQRVTLGFRHTIEKKKRLVSVGVIGKDDDGSTGPIFEFYEDPTRTDGSGTWYATNYHQILYEADPLEYNTDDSVFNYSIGYEYDLRDEVMLYTNVNNGFKPGGISVNSVPNVYYEPEESMNYAVGTRSRWYDNRLELNVEAYLMTYKNMQLNIATDGELTNIIDGVEYTQAYRFSSRTTNLGDTDIYGVEIDYDYLITSNDRIKGNVEYKHAEYGELLVDRKQSTNPPGAARYVQYKGRQMQNSPKLTFYASYSHQFQLRNIMVTPTFDVKWSDKYFCNSEPWYEAAAPNEIWQPAYFKYDAFLNITPTESKWAVNLYGRNLSEEVIRDLVGTDMNIQAPRTFGATLTVNF